MVVSNHFEGENLQSEYAASDHSKVSQLRFNGIRMPLYQICTGAHKDMNALRGPSCIPNEEQNLLESLLLAQWEDRWLRGLFKFDVTQSEVKVIGGQRKFLAQFNEKWTKYSPSNPEEKDIWYQGNKYQSNGLKHMEELLFCITSCEVAESELIPSTIVPDSSVLVIINETPLEYGHVILIPQRSHCLYQFLDAAPLEMVVRIAIEMNSYSFRLFYDCSMEKPSHLYFQACYFPSLLPVELMPVDTFFDDRQRKIQISTLLDYPLKTLLFESSQVTTTAKIISKICSYLLEKSIQFNVLVSACGKKIFLSLQQRSGNLPILSAWECWGYFLFGTISEFDQATEEGMLKRLGIACLDDQLFEGVKLLSCNIACEFAN